MFSILLGKHLGMELLCHGVKSCETTSFPKSAEHTRKALDPPTSSPVSCRSWSSSWWEYTAHGLSRQTVLKWIWCPEPLPRRGSWIQWFLDSPVSCPGQHLWVGSGSKDVWVFPGPSGTQRRWHLPLALPGAECGLPKWL